jgi:hypothetical protein
VAGEHWKDEPEAQDFPAAESYLSLLIGPSAAAKLVKALRKQQTLQHYAAKDILRAASLPLLAPDDSEVAHIGSHPGSHGWQETERAT